MIQTDQNWLKLTKIYQNQPRLTQIDRNWPKLIEIDPNWPNSTQIDKIGGQYASASALASGQVTTKPVRKHWHDDKKLESQCVSTGVRTRYYNEDETKSKWVIDWQLTDWLTDWLLTDWLRLTEETEVRRTENLWFLVNFNISGFRRNRSRGMSFSLCHNMHFSIETLKVREAIFLQLFASNIKNVYLFLCSIT